MESDLHVAIIMDGNGRWAEARGKPRRAGHRAGATAVRRTVEAAPTLGIRALTLYAFSSDNWKRPPGEVSALMRLMLAYLRSETAELVANDVKLTVIGRRDRLGAELRRAIEDAEAATASGDRLHLRVAVDYSARDAILRAATIAGSDATADRESFARALGEVLNADSPVPDVDLLIRTGGEQRLSDFMLWECAYAELYFTQCLWPDFDATELAAAVREFRRRQRRFGAVIPAMPANRAVGQ
ncbi:MAG TPA: di-trans,poly-cis-decaprenylcistransferase [Longimicrobiales bacterium]|nr:di-trans,poly-cis-decaprenylcistransferase [Longimicrobiales bacterium]